MRVAVVGIVMLQVVMGKNIGELLGVGRRQRGTGRRRRKGTRRDGAEAPAVRGWVVRSRAEGESL